ncbi:Myoneurin [Bagarius yarrelli]|uniref:Myoneurin n=1 Tax=Bagarius yarrelli TaxID=175774 RepID=A0A556VXD9_BAGYA|nr:Myoneurin [Bagarius yarrelli]
MDRPEVLQSNSWLWTLYTDLQQGVEMTEDNNTLLRTENIDLKNKLRRYLTSQPDRTEPNRTDTPSVTPTSSFVLEKEQQEEELSKLSCVLKVLQRDCVIEQLKDSVSEYITINQVLRSSHPSCSGEGTFMNVDTTLELTPERCVSLREELRFLSEEDPINTEEEQTEEEEENAETQKKQTSGNVSERSVVVLTMDRVSHGEFLVEQLRKQRERGILCDCTVVIGQVNYEVHRNVLVSFSEYFSKQCIDAGRENTSITLDPECVNSAMFEKLLDYMYTGNLNIDSEEIPHVLNAASYLGMQEVLSICSSSSAKESSVSVRDEIFTGPCSPLSPDDYEPLEPLEEVEEREMLRKEREKNAELFGEPEAAVDSSQLSREQTLQGTEKRIRKPRTRLYEEDEDFSRKESPLSPRGRGRGRGRPRGRPRTRPLDSDKADTAVIDKSPNTEPAVVRRGTGRPRGRPRIKPLSSEAVDSANVEENTTPVNDEEMDTGTVQSETFESANLQGDTEENKNNGEVENKTPSDTENPKEAEVLKRRRGRPRTKSLPSEAAAMLNPEETSTQILQKESVRKRGRPRSKPPVSEIPESDNTEGGLESDKQDEGPDQENNQSTASSSEPLDSKQEPPENAKKIRTSTRKRSLSRKLRESQAGNDENEQEEAAEEEGSEEWEEEEEEEQQVRVLQDKLRPICNVCGNLFSEMSSLRRHMRIHKGLKPYQCQLCGRCFRQGNQLKTHLRIHTGGEKPFSCDRCDASFAQKCQLVYHCRMHHGEEKPHKCDVCPAAFATSSNLKIHMSSLISHTRKHKGSRRVTCDVCGSTLSDIYSLKKHQALKHKEQEDGPQKSEPVECPINIPVDHQGLIARVRSVLSESPEPSFPDESPLTAEASMIIHQPETQMIIKHSEAAGTPMIFQHADASGTQMISASPMIIQHTESSEAPMFIQHSEAGVTPMIIQHSEAGGTPMFIQHSEGSETPLFIRHADASGAQMISGSPMIIQHADSSETPMIIQHSEATGSPMIIRQDESSETPLLIQHGDSGEQVSYVVEQYEIPGSSDIEHAQIVIVQTID